MSDTLLQEALRLGEIAEMKKILVLGCSGSGKSTFSIKLHEKTKLPLYHLDNIWWKADRTHISKDEFDEILSDLVSLDRGFPHSWYHPLLDMARLEQATAKLITMMMSNIVSISIAFQFYHILPIWSIPNSFPHNLHL